jgi:hypothetical protein
MEQTDYHAVRRAPLEEIKTRLQQAKITALIADGVGCKAEDKWVVVEAPSIFGCKVPGDFSTFAVLSDPWEDLKKSFARIFRFFVEEGQREWSIKCGLNGEERSFAFYAGSTPSSYTQEDAKYLSALFELPFEELVPVLKPGLFVAAEFCALVGLPYFEMEMQDKLGSVIPAGTVVFSSELPG